MLKGRNFFLNKTKWTNGRTHSHLHNYVDNKIIITFWNGTITATIQKILIPMKPTKEQKNSKKETPLNIFRILQNKFRNTA